MSTHTANAALALAGLRAWLLWGAVAAVAAGLLSAASLLLDWGQELAEVRLTPGTVVGLLAVVPEVVVLLALLRLADHLDPGHRNPLRRSSICAFGIVWVVMAFGAMLALFPEPSRLTLTLMLVFVGLSAAGLVGYALGGGGLTFFLVVYVLVRFVGGWLAGNQVDRLPAAGIALGIVVVGSLLCYPVWFAIALLRFRDRLGPTATLLAVVVLLNVLGGVALTAWSVGSLAATPGLLAMDDAAQEAVFAPHARRAVLLGLVGEALLTGCVAAFFCTVRRRLTAPVGLP